MAIINYAPVKYAGRDGIFFHVKEDINLFLSMSSTTDMTYTSPMTVTTQPVQSGQTITDNLQEAPKTIDISGVVVVGYTGAFILERQGEAVTDFIDNVETWRRQRRVLSVICKDGIKFEQCVITNFVAKKDVAIANGLRINMTFQEIDFRVQLGRTSDVSTKKDGDKKTTKGSVTSKVEKGSTATTNAAPKSICTNLSEKRGISGTQSLSGDEKIILGNCQTGAGAGYSVKGGTKLDDKAGQAASESLKNTYKNTGGNPNKKA
ncbi:hypothetical protein [Yersinia phage vB_YenM_P778]